MRGGPAAADGVAAPRGNSGAGGGAEVDPAGRLDDEPAPRRVTCGCSGIIFFILKG